MQEDEKIADLEFPQRGIAVDAPLSDQPAGSTPMGVNVRFHESQTQRGRGGSRSGLSRYIDEQASGDNSIQMMDFVVRTDGNALAWEFEGQDFAATGLYLGIDLSGIPGNSQPTGGGGGYQPSASFQENRIRLSLATSHTTRDIADSITITGTVTDENGAPVGLKNVVIHTSPGGRGGDRDGATSSIGTGLANISGVRNDRAETVTYIGIVRDAIGRAETRSRNTVKCIWTERQIEFVQAASQGFGFSALARSVAFSSNVTSGNLIVVCVSIYFDETVTVTDTLGNIYTLADKRDGSGPHLFIYYTTSVATGACTVTVTPSGGIYSGIAILEYSGAHATPLDGTSDNADTNTSMTTGTVTVSNPSSLVLAAFTALNGVNNYTVGAGFTSRAEIQDSDSTMGLFVQELLPTSSDSNAAATVAYVSGSAFIGWLSVGVSFKKA